MDSTNRLATARDGMVVDGEFRVLALDGGGIRGAMIAGYLDQVEAKLGQPIDERVDLIVGTSTGSIVGALLALGVSAAEVKRFYEEKGQHVFEPPLLQQSKWLCAAFVFGLLAVALRLIRDGSLLLWAAIIKNLPRDYMSASRTFAHCHDRFQHTAQHVLSHEIIIPLIGAMLLFLIIQFLVWFRTKGLPLYWLLFAKYGLKNLETQLEESINRALSAAAIRLKPGIKRASARQIEVDDVRRRLLITAYDLPRDEALVIKTQHLGTDQKSSWLLIDAIRCSTAAPFYFPPKPLPAAGSALKQVMYCDGGIWANNPALVGFVEARKILGALGQPQAKIKVLSVGTGLAGGHRFKKPLIGFGILWWAGPFINALWNGQSMNVAYMLSKLVSFPDYIRVNFNIAQALASMDNAANIPELLQASAESAVIDGQPGLNAVAEAVAWLQ